MTAVSKASEDVALVTAMAARGPAGEAALGDLYNRYAGLVMAVLTRILTSQAEAEELLQEVFVELWRRAPSYEAKRARVATWVSTIARSRGIDALRARQRRGGGKHQSVDDTPMQAPHSERPDERVAQSQLSAQVREAMGELSDVQRSVLQLSYFRGMSHREIAEHLDIPVGTVKSRAISGMKVLRGVLASHGGVQ